MATYNPKGASNWEAGKRGFQSALNPCQQVGLLLIWAQNNWKNSIGREFLESRYRVSLPPRTLTAYKSRFKNFWNGRSSIDDMADWSDFKGLIAHGVPERHLASLHAMWRNIQKICLDVGVIPINPTYRSLKWWSYVAEYHGAGIKIHSDIQIIGDQYMDLESNIAKERKMTNMRSPTAEVFERLEPPVKFSLEESLDFIASDELAEVTPNNIRLRKRVLKADERRRMGRSKSKSAS